MAQASDVVIDGVGFMSLHHHDGRFVRGGGLFAFARRDPDGGRTIFCLELSKDISREAVPGHQAWPHAVSRGMNEVLVHLAGSQQALDEVGPDAIFPPLRYDLFEDPAEPDLADGDVAAGQAA
jgi:hypothetical protein